MSVAGFHHTVLGVPPAVLRLVVGVTLVMLLAWCAALALHRASAALRHRVWCLGITVALLLPMLVVSLPEWHLGLIAPHDDAERIAQAGAVPLGKQTLIESLDFPAPQGPITAPDALEMDVIGQDLLAPKHHPSADSATSPPAYSATVATPRVAQFALVVWLAGLLACLYRVARLLVQSRRLIASSQPADRGAPTTLLADIAAQIGLAQVPRLLQSSATLSPLCVGWRRPCIVLPAGWPSWPAGHLRAALAHEAAHVRRRDVAWQMLAGLACAVYWFHPLLWFAARRTRREREIACDDCVLRAGEPPTRYARLLLQLAAEMAGGVAATSPVVVAMAGRRSVERRIRAVLHRDRSRTPVTRAQAAFLTLAAAAVSILIGAASPLARTDTPIVPTPRSAADERDDVPSQDLTDETARISGVLVDERDRPLAGVKVWLRHGASSERRFESTVTDAQGRFAFTRVEPGVATVTAVPQQQAIAGLHYTLQARRMVSNLRLVARPRGLVRLRVVDEQQRPVGGAELAAIAWKTPESRWFSLPPETLQREAQPWPVSADDGRLTLPFVPRGVTYRARVKHAEFARTDTGEFEPTDDPVQVVLKSGAPLSVRAIEAHTGKPATGATVRLTGSPEEINFYDEPVDEHGNFSVRIGEAREFTIHVSHPDLMARRWNGVRGWDGRGEGLSLEFELLRKAKVTGRVVEESTGRGAPDVRVGLVPDGVRQFIAYGRTDDAGAYEIEGPEGPAAVKILSSSGYYGERDQSVHVELDADRIVQAADLLTKRVPAIRGRVLMPDGRPLPRALVSDRTSFHGPSVLVGDDGRFELQPREHEPLYHLTAVHLTERYAGGVGISFDEIQAGTEAQIVLEPESALEGTVVSPDRQPRAGVPLTLIEGMYFGEPGVLGTVSVFSRHASAVTDQRGRYRFAGLSRHLRYRVGVGDLLEHTDAPRSEQLEPAEAVVQVAPIQVPDDLAVKPLVPAAREAPHELRCKTWLNSPPLTLEALRGKVVLLDFWATWCGPCIAEFPELQLAHELFADKGLVVVALHDNSVDEGKIREFVRERNLTFPIGVDTTAGTTFARYDVTTYPTTLLIDRDGRVVPGPLSGVNLLGALRRALLYDAPAE